MWDRHVWVLISDALQIIFEGLLFPDSRWSLVHKIKTNFKDKVTTDENSENRIFSGVFMFHLLKFMLLMTYRSNSESEISHTVYHD